MTGLSTGLGPALGDVERGKDTGILLSCQKGTVVERGYH